MVPRHSVTGNLMSISSHSTRIITVIGAVRVSDRMTSNSIASPSCISSEVTK
jgi:hypothetical protein